MARRKILFVDDEPNILDGLRRMLRSMRKEFDLCFADNAVTALEMMEQEEFDVVVSDMRMPGMDGANLLIEVQKRYPHSIRIMLTGQADDESTLRTIGIVHQFLAKPCDPEKLKTILVRASALHKLMLDGGVKDIVSGIATLPSIPSVYAKLQKKIKDPGASVEDIGAIISQDIAMTAKILQLVNSAFFGLYQKVESPARAVSLIGLDTIKSLVLVSQIFSDTQVPEDIFSIQSLWQHSITVGTFAKKIAESVTDQKEIIDNSYVAGILHDIGKLILISKMESYYRDALDLARRNNLAIREAERATFKTTHSEMGAYLLGLWGFQSDIVEAVGFHHKLEDYPDSSFSPALAVHIANTIYYKFHPEDVVGAIPEFNKEHLQSVSKSENLHKWQELCRTYMEEHGDDQERKKGTLHMEQSPIQERK